MAIAELNRRVYKDTDPFIETYTGKFFGVLTPALDDVDILDIAHALSLTCRYTGHCNDFYSVAEHSVHCSRLVPPEHALAALLHDASEAYLTDVAKPFKPLLTNYTELEDGVMRVISRKFGFQYPLAKEVKYADFAALSAEAHQVLKSRGDWWHWGENRPNVNAFNVWYWPPKLGEEMFLKRFSELYTPGYAEWAESKGIIQ